VPLFEFDDRSSEQEASDILIIRERDTGRSRFRAGSLEAPLGVKRGEHAHDEEIG
jgi:hypothetical protein